MSGNLLANMRSAFTEIFNQASTAVTLRHITRTYTSTENDCTESSSDTSTYAVILDPADYYSEQSIGLFIQGSKLAFFPYTESGVNVQDNVIANSATYVITRIEKPEVGGSVIYQMAALELR